MASDRIVGPITRTRLRRLAYYWGWAAFFSFVAFAFRIGPPVTPEGPGNEQIVQRIMLAGGGLAMLIAWRWEGPGGFLLTFAAIVLGVTAAVGFPPLEALLVTLVFLVPGLALLWAWSSRYSWPVGAVTGVIVTGGMIAGGVSAFDLHAHWFGPAHPQSDLVALPDSEVEWVWSGALSATSIRVNAKVATEGASARLAVDTNEDFAAPLWSSPQSATEDSNRVVSFAVGDLEPDTAYHYAVEVDGSLDRVRAGQFRTPAASPYSFTFAMGACARTGSNGSVFDAIRELDPLFFLALGDFHYENIEVDKPDQFRDAFDTQLESPAQAALFRSTPVAYIWDDHDFGGNNSSAISPGAPAAGATYREYVPHYDLVANGDIPIYQAFTIGRVRFVMTDTRSERTPGTMLGRPQLAWLKAELAAAHETHALTVWVSSVPWIAGVSSGADHWGGYPEERQEIAEFIDENGLDRLVMVAGDAHMLAIDDGSNNTYGSGGPGFPILQAAALDRPGSVKGGPFSEGTFPGGGQFATMAVQDDGDTVRVEWQGYDWELREIVGLDFAFDVPPTL